MDLTQIVATVAGTGVALLVLVMVYVTYLSLTREAHRESTRVLAD